MFAEAFAPADSQVAADDRLVLPYDARCKSRQRVTLASGDELGYVLPAGTVLRHGDRLLTGNGRIVAVEAASEGLLEVRSDDILQLLRAAYHLGNRHVPVQLGEEFLRFQPDHVLAEMLVGLGCVVREVQAPFDPEGGAYAASAHAHSHAYRAARNPTRDPSAETDVPGLSPHRSPAKIHAFK